MDFQFHHHYVELGISCQARLRCHAANTVARSVCMDGQRVDRIRCRIYQVNPENYRHGFDTATQ